MHTDQSLLRQEQELLDQLEILRREKELKEKLAAIRQQLDKVKNGDAKDEGPPRIPKGSWDWERYVLFVVDTLGECKSAQIKEYVEKSNPSLDYDTIDNAVSGKLSILYKDKGLISAQPGNSKKEGYTYYLTEEQKKAAKLHGLLS